jgi:hypothetical protein
MTMSSHLRVSNLAVAALVGLAACATAGDNAPTSIKAPSSARYALGTITSDATPELGKLKVCKSSDSNVDGVFEASRQQFGDAATQLNYAPAILATATLHPGQCIELADDNGGNLILSIVTIRETSDGLVSISAERIDQEVGGVTTTISPLTFGNGDSHPVNSFHGATITFTNHVELPPPPPPAVCDFVTFGRLIVDVNGKKVVISGNAGGNAPGGGFLNEFHVEANGVDNHVANIDSYGAISSGALSSLTNSRMATGTAKNGNSVELRVWDGGEPGKGTDKVYVKINGVELFGADGVYIDQGNIQYHANCRGPKS